MAEDKSPASTDSLLRGVLAEAKSQVKKTVVTRVLAAGGAVLGGIMSCLAVWLKGISDLVRGMLWGSALTLFLLVVALVAVSTWLHLRSRKRAEPLASQLRKIKRKKGVTREDRRDHGRALAESLANAESLTREMAKDIESFRLECLSRGVDLSSLPEDIYKAVLIEYFLGPRDDN